MFIVGNDGRRLYVFDVRVRGCDNDVEQLDVNASNEIEAYRLAAAEADELYTDYTLKLVSVV